MKPRDAYLLGLLSNNDVTFYIPPYQRNYEWTENQCEVFLDDVIRVTEHNLNGTEAKHFFGTIVYVQNEHVFGEPDVLVLTDGQQRITTTMLCLAAIRDLLNTKNEQDYITNKYLKNNAVSSDTEYKIKLKQVESDWETYKNIILNLPISDEEKKCSVWKNYDYFIRRLTSEFANKDYSVLKLIELGLENFNLVTIQLEPTKNFWENPQEIFESMNSLGKPLSLADLVRNYILLGKSSSEQEKLYHDYWLLIEKAIPEHISNFIRDYMQMKECQSFVIATEKNHKELYSSFKKIFSGVDTIALLEDLRKYSKYYAQVVLGKTTASTLIDSKLNDLRLIDVKTLNSFLMELLSYFADDKISESDLAQVLNSFLVYLLRRKILKLTQGENLAYPRLIKKIPLIISAVDKRSVTFEILSDQDFALRLPNDIEVRQQLEIMNFYNFSHCKFILALVEEFITKSRPNMMDKILQIEHIMPQTLNDNWEQMLGQYYDEVHQEYVNNIGNLTLIRHNQELGNKPFDDKKVIYEQNSGMQISKNYITNVTDWDEDAIKDRRDYLIDLLLNKVINIPEIMKNNNNYSKKESKLFSFDEIGLIGETITYIPDKSIQVKVVNDREVEFEGKKWKLSPLVRELETRRGTVNASGSYQGPAYWEFNGKPINSSISYTNTTLRDDLSKKIIYKLTHNQNVYDLQLVASTNTYIRFVSNKIRNKVGLLGDGSWSNINDLIVFEIHNKPNNQVRLSLLIGPGDSNARERWFNFALKDELFNTSSSKLRSKWNSIYSMKLSDERSLFSTDEKYILNCITNLINFLETTYDDLTFLFETASDDYNDDVFKKSEVVNKKVVYTEKDHFLSKDIYLKEIYDEIKLEANKLTDFNIVPLKHWISFRVDNIIIFDVEIYKTKVRAHLNAKMGNLNDYQNKCKDVSHVGHLGCGDYDLSLFDNSDISYFIELVKQVLKLNKQHIDVML